MIMNYEQYVTMSRSIAVIFDSRNWVAVKYLILYYTKWLYEVIHTQKTISTTVQ